jgi:hypothetical protein
MNRFFLIPLLALLLFATGCTCTMRGSASMPTQKPTVAPVSTSAPTAASTPVATTVPETVAPVEPTATNAMPTASATAGN